ncbi:phosphopantetheine-binding protein [Longispora albida]|uniref:phosphopantetheine-binding protein n=1 Tax=Longispora albida TaxID=203523 RepID=UPI00035D04F5|nr:phosphopantetheine-binding protein [Longispora albida]
MPALQSSAEFNEILERNLPLSEGPIESTASLVDLGLDSLGTVSLVMELEEGLGIAFPDQLLTAETFASAEALWTVVEKLVAECSG